MNSLRKRKWTPLLLGMVAALLVGSVVAAAAGAGEKNNLKGAARAAEKAVAAQSLKETAGKGAGLAHRAEAGDCAWSEDGEKDCSGECECCNNQERVENQGEEERLNNCFQNSEGECECIGECEGTSLRLRKRSGDGSGEGLCPHKDDEN